MVLIRPVAPSDLDALVELTNFTGYGLTTLPRDRDFLRKRIDKSCRSFAGMGDHPAGESYLFVMEDVATGRVVGTCGIVSKVGGFEPFYGYHIETQLFDSPEIGVHKEVPILKLVEDHNGPAEIGSLFLHGDFRHGGSGRLLQLVRFLFIAEHPELFETTVISEIRGQLDEHGRSPFWDALGRHFFGIDFAEADRLSVVNKKFIADLMPKTPIYVALLTEAAKAVIGQPHPTGKAALRMLEAEGFYFDRYIDIFDGGPTVTADTDEIRTIRESTTETVCEIADGGRTKMLVATGRLKDFRACFGTVKRVPKKGLCIDRQCAELLEVGVGDEIVAASR